MRDTQLSVRGFLRARALRAAGGATDIVIDVDGCLTPGAQVIGSDGEKPVKVFGLDDLAAIERWRDAVRITFITSDWCKPTQARAESWAVPLIWAPAYAPDRIRTISAHTGNLRRTIYIGDGYHDWHVMRAAGFGIAPADAWPRTLRCADAVASRPGGKRAVALALDFAGKHRLLSLDKRNESV